MKVFFILLLMYGMLCKYILPSSSRPYIFGCMHSICLMCVYISRSKVSATFTHKQSGQPLARQQNVIYVAFDLRADGGRTLNISCVALLFSRGIQGHIQFCDYLGGGPDTQSHLWIRSGFECIQRKHSESTYHLTMYCILYTSYI